MNDITVYELLAQIKSGTLQFDGHTVTAAPKPGAGDGDLLVIHARADALNTIFEALHGLKEPEKT